MKTVLIQVVRRSWAFVRRAAVCGKHVRLDHRVALALTLHVFCVFKRDGDILSVAPENATNLGSGQCADHRPHATLLCVAHTHTHLQREGKRGRENEVNDGDGEPERDDTRAREYERERSER